MAVVTWNGSSSTLYSTAANWDTGSVPGDGDDVVIPDTSSINACNVRSNDSCNSLTVLTNGEIGSDNGSKLATLGEADGTGVTTDGYAVKIDGVITDNTTTSLDLDIRTPATTLIDIVPTSGSIRNLVINHASFIGTFLGNTSISGNLTITAGELKSAGSNSLTVTGDVDISGTLTCNASAVSFGSLKCQGSSTLNATSGTTTITSENSSGQAIVMNNTMTFDNNDGTFLITTPATTNIYFKSDNALHHLTINHASADIVLTGNPDDLKCEGDTNVNWSGTSGGAVELGSLTIASGGTYSATSGTTTITKGSATAGHSGQPSAIEVVSGGTFTNNDGTVLLSSAYDQDLEFDGTGNMHNLTINKSDNDVIHNSNLTIEGDLSITLATAHTFRPNTGSRTLTVTGDVTIVEGKVGDITNYTGAISFGSLEIQSGGEYIATSGTTTITTGGTIGGTTNTAFGGEGTFTHNNGTLVLDSVLHRIPKGGTFYNLKLTGSQSTGGIYLYSDTMLPQGIMPDGTTGSAYFSVLGTLEITEDEFRPYNADKVYIHNLVIGDGTGSANSAKFDFAEVDEFDGKVFVDNVTIHSDGQLLFGDGNETSATEGSSALNIYGAFRNLGGNVTIE